MASSKNVYMLTSGRPGSQTPAAGAPPDRRVYGDVEHREDE
jgi:hypothetical protein